MGQEYDDKKGVSTPLQKHHEYAKAFAMAHESQEVQGGTYLSTLQW